MTRGLRQAQRWLYWTHRWIGIATCLLFAMWFISGLVMIYVGFPVLTEAERRALLPVIDGQQVRVSPADALAAAGQGQWPRGLSLEMLRDEAVYRIVTWDNARLTVSARDGRRIENVDPATAIAIAGNFFLNNALTYRDKRLKGLGPVLLGLASFYAVCSVGAVANVGIANFLFVEQRYAWWVSGIAGILVGAVWNYATSALFTWRKP